MDAGTDTPQLLVDASDDRSNDASDGAVPLPNSPAGLRLAWVLPALNGTDVTRDDVNSNFTSAFLAQVPANTVSQLFAQLSAEKPWQFLALEGPSTRSSLVAQVRRVDGQFWRISLVTSFAEGDKISGLLVSPAADLDPALATFDAVDAAMKQLAERMNMMAAELDGSGCTPIHELGAHASLAIGSAFKLYVLAALAESIDAGQRSWTDPLAIDDAHKSLPSGDLQNQPNGMRFPIRTYADKMISISDNTAADHLLFALGRDAVEATVASAKHHDPTLNRPFLGTRELFTLKLVLSDADQVAYGAASVAEKRAQLAHYDTLDPRTAATSTTSWTKPRHIDTLEWFATPADLCNVARTLKAYGDKPATAPVLDVLAINPGAADALKVFSYVGFKGGSEPGVLNLTWLVRRKSDGRWRFITLGLNDTTNLIDEDKSLYVATAARALLAK